MNSEALRNEHLRKRSLTLSPLSEKLKAHLSGLTANLSHLDAVRTRAKDIDRFMQKAGKIEGNKPKYTDPLNQIQDQVAARIIVFYLSDVERVCEVVRRYFRFVEERMIVSDSPSEFGYEGKHFILFIPAELLSDEWQREDYPTFFELQVKTLFQHAWGEADHDLAYKSTADLSSEQRRRIAFTAAQAWGADWIFQELAHELRPVEKRSETAG